MPIVLIRIGNIAEGELVKSILAASSFGIDPEQDDPGDDSSDETYQAQHPKVSNEEIVVERLVVQSKIVR